MRPLFLPLSTKLYQIEFHGFKSLVSYCAFQFLMLFLLSISAEAQSGKGNKLPSQGLINSKPLDTGTKSKKIDELTDFVIVDYRAGAITGIIEPDGEQSSLKKDLEEQFPVHTVFATSNPQVCVIGVQSTADAKAVFSKTIAKKSRIAKRENLVKMLSEKNVKLITKEK